MPGEKHLSKSASNEALLLEIAREEFQVSDNNGQQLLRVEQGIPTEGSEQLKTLFKKETDKKGELALDIHINESEVLTKRVTLPASTEENLYEVIQYEMDRYTPFSKDDVYFDYRIEDRIKDKELIKVLLIVVRKEVLNPAVHAIENSNLHLQRIDVVNSHNPDQSLQNVKLLRSHTDLGSNQQSSVKWLAVAVVGLLLLTGFTPLIINYMHISKLSSELEGLEKTVQKVKLLQSEYTKMQDQVGYLINIKEKNPSIIELLNLLTISIPDHTYVQRLSLEGGLLSIQGTSASASGLIPIIDESGMFDDIRFSAPVTQSGADGLERYSITAQIKTAQE